MKPIIIGNNNSISPGLQDIVAIGCNDMVFTSDDEGVTYIKNKLISITDTRLVSDGIVFESTVSLTRKISTSSFTAGDDAYNVYVIDASGGNIAVTLEATNTFLIFVRKDASANTVTITPNTGGVINGLGSYGLNVQYEKITVVSDGVDFYF